MKETKNKPDFWILTNKSWIVKADAMWFLLNECTGNRVIVAICAVFNVTFSDCVPDREVVGDFTVHLQKLCLVKHHLLKKVHVFWCFF